MDVIKPYRLEMGTKLETSKGKNLYDFWGNSIQKNVLNDLESQKSDLLINLTNAGAGIITFDIVFAEEDGSNPKKFIEKIFYYFLCCSTYG